MKVVILGGGIIGLATGLELLEKNSSIQLSLLEKESQVGAHQTGNNSGVLHAGLYYKPGSLKAKLAVSGLRKMTKFCSDNSIPYDICGKLVVATSESELAPLDDLFSRGTQNGLKGIEKLGPEAMRKIEPFVGGIKAIRVPEEGIVDYKKVCQAMVARLKAQGAQIHTDQKVYAIRTHKEKWLIKADSSEFEADYFINCAGLYSDKIAQLAGHHPQSRIIPFRGEYYQLKASRQSLVQNLIYPVPDPLYPFLGVHFTRMIAGGVEAGPNAVLAFAREGYHKSDVNLSELSETLMYPGFWKFIKKHRSMCWSELLRSFSKQRFSESLQRLIPDVRSTDLETGGAGVRAQVMRLDGTLEQDFSIIQDKRSIHILNAPSPGATASLAIGEHIVGLLSGPLQERS